VVLFQSWVGPFTHDAVQKGPVPSIYSVGHRFGAGLFRSIVARMKVVSACLAQAPQPQLLGEKLGPLEAVVLEGPAQQKT
jgi:hypothetical protein